MLGHDEGDDDENALGPGDGALLGENDGTVDTLTGCILGTSVG